MDSREQGTRTVRHLNGYVGSILRAWGAAGLAAMLALAPAPSARADETTAIGGADGGFESGLAGMTPTGDVGIVGNVGTLFPTEGSSALLMTTVPDAGSTPADADVATLSIAGVTVPPTMTSLRMDYSFLTNEPSPSLTNDAFTLKLVGVGPGGEEVLLAVDTFDGFTGAAWTGFERQTGFRTLTADVSAFVGAGPLTVELRITDVGDGRQDSGVFVDNLRFSTPGTPVAVSNVNYIEIGLGDPVAFDASGSGDDGTIISYIWDFGNGFLGDGPFFPAFPEYTEPGIYNGTLTVTDDEGNSSTTAFTVVVDGTNRPPEITSSPPTLVAKDNQKYIYDVDATDPELPFGDTLTFSLPTAPVGMSIEPSTGRISWTPSQANPSSNAVVVRATDSEGLFDEQAFTLTVDNSTFVIATDDGSRVYYARSNGDGTWSGFAHIFTLQGTIRGAAIHDFDGDGDLDFAIPSDPGNVEVWLFLNDGNDNFTNAGVRWTVNNGTPAYGMTSGDFDRDGDADFIVNPTDTWMRRGINDGNGNFSLESIDTTFGNGRGIDVGDIDHDGDLDVLRTDTSARVKLYLNNGDGTFADQGQIADSGSDSYGMVVADFNNDGHPDFIGNNASSGDATFYAGNGDGTFQAGVKVPSIDFNSWGKYDDYDFNRDGNVDIIALKHHTATRGLYYYPGNGDGTFGTPTYIGTTVSNTLGLAAPPGQPPAGDPTPRITPDLVIAAVGESVGFDGGGSTDDGTIVSFDWDFGDTNTDTGAMVSHAFAAEGRYPVRLDVTDDDSNIASAIAQAIIQGAPPVANAGGPYTLGDDEANNGFYTTQLDGIGSTDDAGIVGYKWDLGNGFDEDFSGTEISRSRWQFTDDVVLQAGGGGNRGVLTSLLRTWGPRWMSTRTVYTRQQDDSYRAIVSLNDGGGPDHFIVWGLKNTNTNYHQNQFHYAFYFWNQQLRIYENGGHRTTCLNPYNENTDYEVRIDVKHNRGATYYVREAGSPAWTRCYDSLHATNTTHIVGASAWSGQIQIDSFVVPSTMSTATQPTATFPGPGTYDVSLMVTDAAGQTDTDTTTVTVELGDPPVANPGGPYALDETNASCNTWTFTANGTGSTDDGANGILSYSWDFGDGGTGTGATPSHTYAGPGTYTVTLTVTDHGLQTHSASTTVTTSANGLPTANPGGPYAVDESSASDGFWNATFNGGASTDDVGICDYAWDFGDGGTGSGVSPTHQYAAAGTYTVTLTVRDHAHQSHSASTTIEVTANDAPVAADGGPYVIDEAQANAGQWTASFDGTGSTDDFGIWRYEWDFGDGGTGTGATPTHVYNSTGTYEVALTVTDNGRQSSTDSTTIQVLANDPPVANAGPARVTERGLPVLLDGTGSTDDFGIYTYAWNITLPPFLETFATGIDSSDWRASGASPGSGDAVVVGAGSWGNRYLFSQALFTRSTEVTTYTGKIYVQSGGSRHVMWGLKNTNTNFSFTQLPYAIYFTNNSVQIYEYGAFRGTFGSFVDNTSYDVRIDLKPGSGAIYYYRETGASTWTQLRDTTNFSDSVFLLGATVHSGTIRFDDFAGQSPGVSNTDKPSLTVTYDTVGTYTPSLTVTDHASQTDTDSTTITVLEGNDPVADIGGPYTTNEYIPTRFNGRGSTDDFGIRTYTWDFGDGTVVTTFNPFADHRYTSSGTFTATLTVADFAGHTHSDSVTVTVNPDPVIVAVPWRFSGGIEIQHDTFSGREVTLKAVGYSGHGPLDYTWDFGDGSPTVSGTATTRAEMRTIQAKHTYTSTEVGRTFIATVTVTDADGRTAFDNYFVRIQPNTQDTRINIAIDDGLWYLHRFQQSFVSESGGFLYGYWNERNFDSHATASAVQAFMINGHLELGDVRENPYVETVSRGLRSLMTMLRAINIGPQTYGDPDTNQNGIGVETAEADPIYQGGQIMDAIAATGSADTFADTGGVGIRGRTYKDIAQDMIDAYAWGQFDHPTTGGGWRYVWNQSPDNSACQWAAIGALALKQVFGLDFPQWVKDRNEVWLNFSHQSSLSGGTEGGFGYNGASHGIATSPSGLVQMVMNGSEKTDPRWARTEKRMVRNWDAWYRGAGNGNNYYSAFAMAKSFRLALPEPVVNLTGPGLPRDGLDWFNDPNHGLARRLIGDQQSNGQFYPSNGRWAQQPTMSSWAIIMLTPTLFVQPPVADAGDDRVWGVDIPLTLNGSGSFHTDPLRSIVNYEWDIDGDGTFDITTTDPTTSVTYTSADYCDPPVPPATEPDCETPLPVNITVTLRVTDNNDPAQFDTDTVSVVVAVPPHPPVADAGGPYTCTEDIPCALDGSGSFDIDPTDSITSYDWDLDNDGAYDDASGATPSIIFPDPTGIPLNIGLQVFDDAVLNDLDGDFVQDPEERLSDTDFTTVTVLPNNPPVSAHGGPYTVDEGSPVTLDGSGSSDPDGNPIVSYEWDLDDDGTFGDASGAVVMHTFVQDGSYPVALRVSDSALTGESSTTVTVNNVLPTVEAGNDQTITEGDTLSLDPASFTDPGTADEHTATIDWGDGSAVEAGTVTETLGTGMGTVSGSHLYVQDGIYTVTVSVSDDDGTANDTFTVTVLNAAPIIVLAEDRTSNEGDVVSINDPVKFTDAGVLDTHTATFDWGDGSPVEDVDPLDITEPAPPEPGMVVGSHVYVDDADYTARVTVEDRDSGSGFADFAATVNNLPPVVEAGADQTVDEGDTVSLDPASFTDAGVADTHTATIDWGDGSPVMTGSLTQGAGSGSVEGSHVYADNGVYTVTVTVEDDDGGIGSDTLTVTVNNLPPVVEAGGDQSIVEGGSISLDPAAFTDPGTADEHDAVIDWGDGTTTDVPNVVGSVAGSHSYGGEGIFTVTVTVTDDDGGVGSDTFTVNVSDAGGPTVDAGPDVTIDEGQSVSLPPSTFVPAIGTDTHTASINWGDGSPDEPGSVDDVLDTVSGSRTYPQDGSFSVGVTVTNQDDTSGADSFNVTVNNVAPAVEAGADQAVNVGDTVTLDPATFTDPGTQDIHTATIDWGDGSAVDSGAVGEPSGSDPGTVGGSHVYTDPGIYTVTVTVADDDTSTSDTLTVVVSSTGAPPAAIDDLVAAPKSGKIDLVWTPVDGAVTYNVYRSLTPGGPYDLISSGWTCTYCAYADFGLTNGVTYHYVVTGVNATGESPPSNEANGTPAGVVIRPR